MRTFTIDFQAALDDLRRRVRDTRCPDAVTSHEW